MKTLLRIDSSLRKTGSHSRALADHFQSRWLAAHPGAAVRVRDLAAPPVPHLDAATLAAFFAAPGTDRRAAAFSDELISELKAADQLLISSPLYNFGPPSPLKAWIDHVVRSGETFVFAPDGHPRGLLSGKRACLITTRGGTHDTSAPDDDFLVPAVRAALRFIGLADIDTLSAEGMALDAPHRENELARARRNIDALVSGNPIPTPVWLGEFTARDRAEIDTLRLAQADAIVQGDIHTYQNLCAPDIHWLFPGHDIVSGHDAFLDAQNRLRSRFPVQAMHKHPLRIERAGDLAIEIGHQEVEKSGEPARVRQKYTHIFRKTPQGWRFAVLMSNASE